MPNAYYFRQQADTCARLALATSDADIAERFACKAHEYLAKAAEAEQASETSVISEIQDPPPAPDDIPAEQQGDE
jgi:hypothetical protein